MRPSASSAYAAEEWSVSSLFLCERLASWLWFIASGHSARWCGAWGEERKGKKSAPALLRPLLSSSILPSHHNTPQPRLPVQFPRVALCSSRSPPHPIPSSHPPACTSIRAPRPQMRHSWQSCENLSLVWLQEMRGALSFGFSHFELSCFFFHSYSDSVKYLD